MRAVLGGRGNQFSDVEMWAISDCVFVMPCICVREGVEPFIELSVSVIKRLSGGKMGEWQGGVQQDGCVECDYHCQLCGCAHGLRA